MFGSGIGSGLVWILGQGSGFMVVLKSRTPTSGGGRGPLTRHGAQPSRACLKGDVSTTGTPYC